MKTAGTPAARLLVGASLALWLGAGLMPRSRPAPVPASAPAAEFSSARAIEYVRAFAQRPHPIGSAEHERVRDYLLAELTKLGLAPQVEKGYAEFTYGRYHASGNVENIVARMAGTANTRPVMLAAHYDSVPTGPGAADDGHGVGTLLETLRALRAGPALRNDVIFLITDGEERGLLGAQVFMREHPWHSEPGVTLNFEARGVSGSAYMFETSANNGWLIHGLKEAVPQADATSVSYEIYRRMPNGTDLTVFKDGGLAGMNFAFIEQPEFYHMPQDSVDHLDPVSVQEQGRYALSLTRWFGGRDLREHEAGDAVYFATAFTSLIVYSAGMAKALAILTLLVALVAAWRAGWIGVVLLLVAGLNLWVTFTVTGVSYLLTWAVLGGAIAAVLLASAPPRLAPGVRVIAVALCAAPAFVLVIPMMKPLIVALTWRGAAPAVAVAAVLIVLCILPQLRFALRAGTK